MRRADRLSAEYVFIIGDEELNAGILKWKRLADSSEGTLPISESRTFLSGRR
jgi:histidyl-tRNA synthetase